MAYSSQTNLVDFGDVTVKAAAFTSSAGDLSIDDDLTVGGDITASTVGIGSNFTLQKYTATVTVANGATTGKEAAINIPAKFLPLGVEVNVTVAATNAVNLNDIGDDADTDSYVDGLAIAVNTTGYKGFFSCNGTRGFAGGTTAGAGAMTTPDEVEVVISGDPGATGVTMTLDFIGIVVA